MFILALIEVLSKKQYILYPFNKSVVSLLANISHFN